MGSREHSLPGRGNGKTLRTDDFENRGSPAKGLLRLAAIGPMPSESHPVPAPRQSPRPSRGCRDQ